MKEFDESKHKRDELGRFAKMSAKEISEELKQEIPDKKSYQEKKTNNIVHLDKKSYAKLCSAVRTKYGNNIPKKGSMLIGDYYYKFKYNKHSEQILCTLKLEIEGNEHLIRDFKED